ncbi:MAG: Soluble guanylyl cyclase beta 1 subunit [Labilithrix sp.]|nr:Soluble guanylyl cyclase beta 1 subunit [Labilithrix sp.]
MKGTVITCLREVVLKAAGEATWQACLADAKLPPFTIFTLTEDVPDAQVMAIVDAVCARLGISAAQAGDAFGAHWIGAYAPRLYKHLFAKYKSARELFTDINNMHDRVTRHVPDAKPPRFRLEWPAPDTLVMHYESRRGLIDIAVGMARAVGGLYGEELVVTKLSEKSLRVVFAAGA